MTVPRTIWYGYGVSETDGCRCSRTARARHHVTRVSVPTVSVGRKSALNNVTFRPSLRYRRISVQLYAMVKPSRSFHASRSRRFLYLETAFVAMYNPFPTADGPRPRRLSLSSPPAPPVAGVPYDKPKYTSRVDLDTPRRHAIFLRRDRQIENGGLASARCMWKAQLALVVRGRASCLAVW